MFSKESIMEYRDKLIKSETGVEGGYVNDPSDLGGETNHGVTVAVAESHAEQLTEKFGWDGTMKNLTTEMAHYVYVKRFWDRLYLNEIAGYSLALAATMFRWGIKSGTTKPAGSIQETLNCLNNKHTYWEEIKVDGWIGPKTLKVLDAFIEKRGLNNAIAFLIAQTNADQLAWMKDITIARANEENEKYYYGWGTRIIRENAEYLDMLGIPRV